MNQGIKNLSHTDHFKQYGYLTLQDIVDNLDCFDVDAVSSNHPDDPKASNQYFREGFDLDRRATKE